MRQQPSQRGRNLEWGGDSGANASCFLLVLVPAEESTSCVANHKEGEGGGEGGLFRLLFVAEGDSQVWENNLSQ